MITLENFINLCNLEGIYCFTSVEERECCWKIILVSSPKIGKTLDQLEQYYDKIVTNVMFNNENGIFDILIEVK